MNKICIYAVFLLALLSCGPDTDIFNSLNKKPGVSGLLFPINNETCTEGSVISESESEITFLWEPSVRTDSYTLFIFNLLTSETTSYISSEPTLGIVLQRGTPYSWYVESRSNNSNETTKSETWAFYNAKPGITNHVPFPAEVISPINESEINSAVTIDLIWSAKDLDNDIIGYDILFGEDASPPLFQSNSIENQLNVPIVPGKIYFWKIITKDTHGNASSSAIFSFKVRS